jgi:hypothetical protein
MRAGTVTRILFVLYCLEAGLVLALAPWNPAWDRLVVQISLSGARNALLHPLTRAGITGFGLVHWVWGLHDLHLWLRERRDRASH